MQKTVQRLKESGVRMKEEQKRILDEIEKNEQKFPEERQETREVEKSDDKQQKTV